MEKVRINTEFIKLDQFIKWVGIAGSGSEAKSIVSEEMVKVNGKIEVQRGKKLRKGDIIDINGSVYEIV
jgi:ribosome-associated protein